MQSSRVFENVAADNNDCASLHATYISDSNRATISSVDTNHISDVIGGCSSRTNDLAFLPPAFQKHQRRVSQPMSEVWKECTPEVTPKTAMVLRRVQSLPSVDLNAGRTINAWAEAGADKEVSHDTRHASRLPRGQSMLQVGGTDVYTPHALRARIMTSVYRTGRRKSTIVSNVGISFAARAAALHLQETTVEASVPEGLEEKLPSLGELPEAENEEGEEDDDGLEIRLPEATDGFVN